MGSLGYHDVDTFNKNIDVSDVKSDENMEVMVEFNENDDEKIEMLSKQAAAVIATNTQDETDGTSFTIKK